MEIEQLNTIATFFGALVVLIIFTTWKKQKGSEVISNLAKEAFDLISSLPNQSNVILEDMLKMAIENSKPFTPNDFDKSRFESFKAKNIESIKILDLISFKNNDLETKNIIENYVNSYKSFGVLYFKPSNTKEILELHTFYSDNLEFLKFELYKYILYKKTL